MHIDIIVTLIVAVFGSTGFWTWVQTRNKKKSAETRLLLGLAYSEIINRADACISRGWVEVDEYNELDRYLYRPYAEMGGNGTAQKLMNEVRNLPTRKEAGK
mgnify:FL=1